jgi:hypothetical protein
VGTSWYFWTPVRANEVSESEGTLSTGQLMKPRHSNSGEITFTIRIKATKEKKDDVADLRAGIHFVTLVPFWAVLSGWPVFSCSLSCSVVAGVYGVAPETYVLFIAILTVYSAFEARGLVRPLSHYSC